MPQFDFFAWASMSFWTIISFHIVYFYLLKNIIAPVSEFQKIQQKISLIFSHSIKHFSIKEIFLNSLLNKQK
jgi:hypothetical protein